VTISLSRIHWAWVQFGNPTTTVLCFGLVVPPWAFENEPRRPAPR